MCERCEAEARLQAEGPTPRQVAFEAHVRPLLVQLAEACRTHELPLVVAVNVAFSMPGAMQNIIARVTVNQEPHEFTMATDLLHFGAAGAALRHLVAAREREALRVATEASAATVPGGGH